MRNSLKKLLDEYPYFITKKKDSNQYKSEWVFNERFRDLYLQVYETYLSTKLNKHILINKEQYEDHYYTLNFYIKLKNLKSVRIYRDDEYSPMLLQEAHFTEESETDHYEYNYVDFSDEVIPSDKFYVEVETWDEYRFLRGYPQIDSEDADDKYCIDYSLDEIGSLLDFKRLYFTPTDQYTSTYPPYNIDLVENDYLYMNRLLYYIQGMYDTPLPLLRLYQLYNIRPAKSINDEGSRLVNREEILCKMIVAPSTRGNEPEEGYYNLEDVHYHLDETGKYNELWAPTIWEHKDIMCTGEELEFFFFVDVDNAMPVQGNDFQFLFEILNDKFRLDDTEWSILPFVKKTGEEDYTGLPSHTGLSTSPLVFNTVDIDNGLATFIFKAFKSEELLERYILEHTNSEGKVTFVDDNNLTSDEIAIDVAGCNNADWFVSTNGDDSNPGTSREYPFRTIEKAVSVCNGRNNTIGILQGNYTLLDTVKIITNTNIIGCGDVTIECDKPYYFAIYNDTRLNISEVTLKFMEYSSHISQANFINKSKTSNPLYTTLNVLLVVADKGLDGTMLFSDKTGSTSETKINFTSMDITRPEWDYIDISETGNNRFFEVRPESDNPRLLIHNKQDLIDYKQRMIDEHE